MERRQRRRLARVLAVAAIVAVVVALLVIVRGPSSPPRHASSRGTTLVRSAGDVVLRSRAQGRHRPPGFRGPAIAGAAARRIRVPILMYHVIAPAPPGAPFPQLWVPPRRFAAQVRALARAGYAGVTLGEVMNAWRHGARMPRRPVVLSFDDGYESDATRAAPVLRRLHWPGVLDLAIRNVGRRGIALHSLQRLVEDGWEVDSHTVHHPDLTTLSPRAVRAELLRSRAWIHRRLGVRAPFFCYPAGRFDPAVVAAVRAAGYRGATAERDGLASAGDDPYELPRLRVTATTRPAALAAAA